jgi:predicted homoserine dehydrogenase-like protein
MYRPYHLIGMELAMSVYSLGLREDPTGMPLEFRGDVVAVAKRDLPAGEELDGEGGYTVWGKLMPAARSVELGALPIGFAKGVALAKGVRSGEVVRLSDVSPLTEGPALTLRRETLALAV